jgi:hypothetical protein
VTGKFKSTSRIKQLIKALTDWHPTASPGRDVAVVPQPAALARPVPQYAIRSVSKDRPDG